MRTEHFHVKIGDQVSNLRGQSTEQRVVLFQAAKKLPQTAHTQLERLTPFAVCVVVKTGCVR